MSHSFGPSIYDVRKIFGFFDTPLSPITHMANFVPFICLLGDPLPPPSADVIYGSPLSWNRPRSLVLFVRYPRGVNNGGGFLQRPSVRYDPSPLPNFCDALCAHRGLSVGPIQHSKSSMIQ